MGNSVYSILSKALFLSTFLFIYSCNGVGTAEFDSVAEGANVEGKTPEVVIPPPPPTPPIFAGLGSVTSVTDSTATLNWSSSPDAANYHIYDVSSGTQVYRGLIVDPNANSFLVSGLTPDTSYIYRLRMLHNQGLIDSNTVDVSFHTNLAPSSPSTPTLHIPATSPGIEARPILQVGGVKKDDVVRIFKDDQCSTVAGEEISLGSSVQIQVDDPLDFGTYLFSANATNSLGHSSDCSGTVEFIRELPAYYPMIEASSASLAGSAGMTQIYSVSTDDGTVQITIPFDFYIAGTTFGNWFVGSNTYLTAGMGSTAYSGFAGNHPAIPRIMLGAADNSFQGVYTKTGANFYRVRYEGTAATSGTIGSPNIVFEVTFFKPVNNEQYIQVTFGTHARNTGVFGIASASSYYLTQPSITANSSYVFVGNADGTSWVLHANSKITGNGVDE